MRNFKPIIQAILLLFFSINMYSLSAQNVKGRKCGSEIGYENIIGYGGAIAERYQQLERFTQQYIQNLRQGKEGFDGARATSIIIPVVVHIVWNTAAQNIPDARVFEQIERLNLDYQKLNPDAASVPAEFAGVASNMQIRFQLAVRDPNCNMTSGITRTNTAVTSFSNPTDAQASDIAFNPVKSTAAGGIDAWPADRYLNIWVCNFTDATLLGYSSFPTFPANVDGVVIVYTAFGNTSGDFNLGRTATHEIGHYLNLYHPFQGPDCAGGTAADCTVGGDRVCDTPPITFAHLGCPSGTINTCSESPDQNDQWMNFMDYPNDACMYMFSNGQKERVDACIYGSRSSLLSSDALIPVASGGTADLWSQDLPDDVGAEPNSTSTVMYLSEDIWVRNAEGLTDQEHENPVSNTVNHVYVRVRNRVCGTNGNGKVRLFWAKASPSLSWPAPWDGTIVGPPVMGGEIGLENVNITGGNISDIVHFTWNTPNLDDYAAMGADAGHFCLLARIETGPAPDYGLANPAGTGDLWNYVKNNNNIVWKNVEVVPTAGGGRKAALIVGNMDKTRIEARLVFNAIPDDHKVAFTDVGKIRVKLGEKLFKWWQAGNKKGDGIITTNDQYTIEIQKNGAFIEGLMIEPSQLSDIQLQFEFTKHVPWGTHKVFHVRVEQWAKDNSGNDRRIGGQDFAIRNPKTADDNFKGGATTSPTTSHGFTWSWWMGLVLLLIFILLFWFLRHKKTKKP